MNKQAGRDLDAEVAQRVMKWRGITYAQGSLIGYNTQNIDGKLWEGYVPHYSSDLESAWQVLKAVALGYKIKVESEPYGFSCSISNHTTHIYRAGDTAPHAICLAALALLEAK